MRDFKNKYINYRNDWHNQPKRAVRGKYYGEKLKKENFNPLCFDIEVASVCDLACPFCYRQYVATPDKIMTKELAFKLIDQASELNIPSMKFNWRGEPLLNPALSLKEIPKVDLFLLTHNHYDHQDTATIRKFPYKDANVIVPLKLGKYFTKYNYKKVNELDWFQTIQVNDLKITLLPAVHWSKRSLTDTNKTLWGKFLIEYKNKKILFACDTGYGQIYKKLGEKFGPVDLTMINIGAYDFRPMFEKSIYHTNPEEALQVAKDLKSKKVIGTHWGTFVLSLEPIMELSLIHISEPTRPY